jgi:hypothetical protein
VSNSILFCSKKIETEIEKMINMILNSCSLVEEEEQKLLTVEEWQHLEADNQPKEVEEKR